MDIKDYGYEIRSVLYDSDHVKVFLVFHNTLKQTRIAKRIEKGADVLFGNDFREMEILKELKHISIPTLFDCLEDEKYIWLIEEYVEGLTLKEYLKLHHQLTFDEVTTIILEICDVLQYLHEGFMFPILYRDLKPEHIIVRGSQIVLIDYGAALCDDDCGVYEPYGTPGYISPEIINGQKSDVRGDIYSLGVIAKMLLSHVKGRVPFGIKRLVASAVEKDINLRISSVLQFAQSWKDLAPKIHSDNYSYTNITVVGTAPSCGVTHIAISLVVFLNSIGKDAYYAELPGSCVCNMLTAGSRGFREKELIVYHHNFKAVCAFEEGIENPKPPKGIRVCDGGCDIENTKEAELVILVTGSRPWQYRGIRRDYLDENVVILVNPSNHYIGSQVAKTLGKKVYAFPLDEDAFYLSAEKKKLFEKIMQNV